MAYEIVDFARDVPEVEVLREVTTIGRTMGFSRRASSTPRTTIG